MQVDNMYTGWRAGGNLGGMGGAKRVGWGDAS